MLKPIFCSLVMVFIALTAISQPDSTINLLFQEAETLYKARQLSDALSHYQRISKRADQQEEYDFWKKANSRIYSIEFIQQNYKKCISVIDDLLPKLHRTDSMGRVGFLVKKAYAYRNLGELKKSNHAFEQTFHFIKAIEKSYLSKYILLPLSANYATLFDLTKAIQYQKTALQHFEEAANTEYINIGYNNLGEYYFLKKEFTRSLKSYRFVTENKANKSNSLDLATAYIGISKVFSDLNQLDSALYYNETALGKLMGIEPPSYAAEELKIEAHLNKAAIYDHYKEYERAINLYKKAIGLSIKYYGNNHRKVTLAYNRLGYLYIENKAFDKAIEAFENGYECVKNQKAETQLLDGLVGKTEAYLQKGSLTHDQGHYNTAFESLDLATSVFDELRSQYSYDQSKYALAGYFDKILESGIALCYQLRKKDKKYYHKAFSLMEQSKSMALQDAIYTNVAAIADNARLEEKQALIQVKNQYIYQLNEAQINGDSVAIEKWNKKTIAVSMELDQLNSIAYKKDTNEVEIDSTVNFSDYKKFVFAQYDGCVEYYQTKDFIYSIAFTTDTLAFDRMPLDADFLNKINAFRAGFHFENRHQFNYAIAHELHDKLWQKRLFNEKIKKVLIIPDGALSYIPFEALAMDNAPVFSNFLVHQFDISYANSAHTLMLADVSEQQSNQKVLSVAPVFKDNAQKQLLNSLEEINGLGKLIASEKLIHGAATKAKFIEKSPFFSVLHLSTHAKSDEKTETSYIEFFDQKLFLQELYNLKFKNDLVVLSACETGAGKLENTEGVLSLSRAFTYAGVPSVVSGMWKVDEQSTTTLFEKFYTYLASEETIAASLAQSKRDYLNDKTIPVELKTPYYWAGFLHYGIEKAVPLKKNHNLYLYLSAFLLISIVGGWFLKRKLFKVQPNKLKNV